MNINEIRRTIADHEPRPIGRYRYYSVLLPLIETPSGIQLLFEVRAETMRKQPGEISFPGGKMEANETPEACAARETSEELGIPLSSITVFGQLNYIVTYSNFTMYSCAGSIEAEALEAMKPCEDEVSEVFSVPLDFFIDSEPDTWTNEVRPVIAEGFPIEKIRSQNPLVTLPGEAAYEKGYKWRTGTAEVPVYTWHDSEIGQERIIWGLTARLIADFVGLLKQTV